MKKRRDDLLLWKVMLTAEEQRRRTLPFIMATTSNVVSKEASFQEARNKE